MKLRLFLCSLGIHRLHPAKITFSQEQFERTGEYLRQCMRCGCLLPFREKRPGADEPDDAPVEKAVVSHYPHGRRAARKAAGEVEYDSWTCGVTGTRELKDTDHG